MHRQMLARFGVDSLALSPAFDPDIPGGVRNHLQPVNIEYRFTYERDNNIILRFI